jgi:uncharacterized protein
MSIPLYDATVLGFIQTVDAMQGVLQKGLAFCQEKGIDTSEIVESRVHPDMLPFRFQVISVANHSAGAIECARAGVFDRPPQRPPLSYAELQSLLAESSSKLKSCSPADINALQGRELVFKAGGSPFKFTVENFLLSFSTPNLHFHAATAYGILRGKGVPIGKRDFLGAMRVAG